MTGHLPVTKGAGGRPPKEPPANAAARIEKYAAQGYPVTSIAGKFAIATETLYRWMRDYPALKEARDLGKAKEEHALARRLYRTAMKGKGKEAITAAIFLLKAKYGWREGDREDAGNRLNVVFNLPGPMNRDDFLKMVTVSSDQRK